MSLIALCDLFGNIMSYMVRMQHDQASVPNQLAPLIMSYMVRLQLACRAKPLFPITFQCALPYNPSKK
jgi:hypothetical protein